MEPISLPKNVWIDKAVVQFHKGGFYHGYPELNIHFKGEPPSTATMLEILQALAPVKLPKLQLVWLNGAMQNDEAMYFLIRSLRDYGFFVGIETQLALGYPVWYPLASWIQLWSPSPFVPFSPQELIYCPKALPAPDVVMPSDPAHVCFMRLNPAGISATQDELMEFMRTSKYTWAIL